MWIQLVPMSLIRTQVNCRFITVFRKILGWSWCQTLIDDGLTRPNSLSDAVLAIEPAIAITTFRLKLEIHACLVAGIFIDKTHLPYLIYLCIITLFRPYKSSNKNALLCEPYSPHTTHQYSPEPTLRSSFRPLALFSRQHSLCVLVVNNPI